MDNDNNNDDNSFKLVFLIRFCPYLVGVYICSCISDKYVLILLSTNWFCTNKKQKHFLV